MQALREVTLQLLDLVMFKFVFITTYLYLEDKVKAERSLEIFGFTTL